MSPSVGHREDKNDLCLPQNGVLEGRDGFFVKMFAFITPRPQWMRLLVNADLIPDPKSSSR